MTHHKKYFLHLTDDGTELHFDAPPPDLPSIEVFVRGSFDSIEHYCGLPSPLRRAGGWYDHPTEERPAPWMIHYRRLRDPSGEMIMTRSLIEFFGEVIQETGTENSVTAKTPERPPSAMERLFLKQ
jgi:hypothetical protein